MSEKWDRRLLGLCFYIAEQWSKDPDRVVGAVLARKKNRDIIPGYNGFPTGIEDTEERLSNRELKRNLVIHAELNAILTAKRDLSEYTMYSTFKPCISCSIAIVQADIRTVVYPRLTEEDLMNHSTYIEGWNLADDIFQEAGVTVREIDWS